MIPVNVGPAERIPPGEGREFRVWCGSRSAPPDARVIAVFRARTGSVYATQARCPHKSGPLAEGLLGGTTLACPLHGCRFDVASGSPLGGTGCTALRTYETRIDDRGDLIVVLPEEEA